MAVILRSYCDDVTYPQMRFSKEIVAYCPEPVRVPDPVFPTGCDLERECRYYYVGHVDGGAERALTIILQKSSPLQVAAAAVGALGMWVIFRRKIKQQGVG